MTIGEGEREAGCSSVGEREDKQFILFATKLPECIQVYTRFGSRRAASPVVDPSGASSAEDE